MVSLNQDMQLFKQEQDILSETDFGRPYSTGTKIFFN